MKIIILYGDNDDIDEKLWLSAISGNPAFDFLKDNAEDIYTPHDGKPIKK